MIESYKRREIALILLNIAVLAALIVVHIIFLFEIGKPSVWLLATLSLRFVLLMVELVWLQRLTDQTSSRKLRVHTHISIAVNIVFAFAASVFGGTADSHYSVLMIIPLIQAAYHFELLRVISIAVVVILLTLLEVSIYFRRKPPVDYGELFEAATVSLIFLVVGIVVWLLVGDLRKEELKLTQSLGELTAMQEKLVREERLAAVGQLASAIAHEIRNPVAMIASSLDLADKQPENSTVRAEMYAIATQESKRLETLTGEFLTFARARPPAAEVRNVRETLEYCAALVAARMRENSIDVTVDCDPDISATFDGAQIQQAVLNLVLNAADAVGRQGRIRIGAKFDKTRLGIFVENDGQRIPPEIAAGIFEPFVTSKPKGTGLGLAIVRQIADGHAGEIALARNDDELVRFELTIPQDSEWQRY